MHVVRSRRAWVSRDVVWKEIQLEPLSDAELFAKHLAATGRDGGTVWVEELFRRHYQKVVCWCLRFARNRNDAYDIAQGIFVKAYRHLESFRGDSKVSRWLYSITRSECMNFLKARSARPERLEGELLEELPDRDASSADQVLEREGSARIVRTLLDQSLDEIEKQVFTLHYGDDVPLKVITRLLGLTNRSGAKAYIVSARRKLSRAVRQWKAREQPQDG
jgi:RNA polymerase sigma-70 factor, ECF subfamily